MPKPSTAWITQKKPLFLQGIHHVQKEPVWGGSVDTAPALRGTCALGLVRMNYTHVMTELADLLADPEFDFLLALITQGKPADREAAIGVLKMSQQDAILWQRVQQAIAGV